MRRAIAIVTVLLATLTLAAAGCGGEEEVAPTPETVEGTLPTETTGGETADLPEGDPGAGAAVYESAGCGGCHTMEAAGSTGTVGPNLDDSQPSLELTIDRVSNGQGSMPSFGDQLSEQEIADVSAYVVDATGGS